jgi:excisionase family DNA binding protein
MTLTELLPTIRQLSTTDRRELIRILMAEEDINDEQMWNAQFEAITDTQWDSLAEMVRQEIAAGDITALVDIFPFNAELTTQKAAQLLNVSRSYLAKLLKSGEIPFHQVGRHQRIRFEDVMKYKKWIDNERLKVLDELAFQAQELNMGYE